MTALIIGLGLVAAQTIASVHVYLSNWELHGKMQVLKEAGYLIVPNSHILPLLTGWKQAVFGGLFFTLSVGAFLTLLSLAAAWVRHRLFPGVKAPRIVFLLSWLALVLALNLRGLSVMATLYALAIPPLVFSAASRWGFTKSSEKPRPVILFHLFPPLLLALLWTTQMEGRFFGDIRDYLLLSNPAGIRVSDFYYRYTLYAAEAFKSPGQKQVKSVFLKGFHDQAGLQTLERELLKHDYLSVDDEKDADLTIVEGGRDITLHKGETAVSSANLQSFLASPAPWLSEFSVKTDPNRLFRFFTFIAMIIGFPLLLYLLLYGFIRLLLRPLASARTSSAAATLTCFLTGILLFILFVTGRGAIHDDQDVAQALQSKDPKTKVAALKHVYDKGLEIARYPAYRDCLDSSSIPVRSWFAKTLGVSRRAQTFRDLLALTEDPHPTIVSASFQALEKRKNPAAIPCLLAAVETSTDWYNQWNAYRALKAVGWKQSKLL